MKRALEVLLPKQEEETCVGTGCVVGNVLRVV